MRNKIFEGIGLLEIFQFLRNKKNVLFHSSNDKFEKLVPHQGNATYHHGNYMAVYAQANPYEAILRALKNRISGLSAVKKVDNDYRFFAEKKIRENFSPGYIHILINQNFFYSSHEFYTFSSVIPIFVFEVNKLDLPFEIESYPFYEVPRNKEDGLFKDYERDLIREICLNQYSIFENKVNIKMHGFEHIYRVSEMAFNFALRECPDCANEIFIGACLHDIGRDNDDFDKNHGIKRMVICNEIINKYFNDYKNQDVNWAIKYHTKGVTSKNPVIGCILDADRIDLLRHKIIPKEKLLSTNCAKEMLRKILNSISNIKGIFDNWELHLDYFRKLFDSKVDLPNKFFKKVNINKFRELSGLINKNYNGLGRLLEVYKYTKHSCNKIHLFVFANKMVIVKFSDRSEKQIMFENYLINLLKNKVNLPQIIKTNKERLFLKIKKQKVILSEFVENGEINYETLEADVINLLNEAYENKIKIVKKYQEFLPKEFRQKKGPSLGKKDLAIVKNQTVKRFIEKNLNLINKYYVKEKYLAPVFKGLQVVGNEKGNYFLGTEHLYELYAPINQAIANYIVNLIFLSDREYGIKDIKNLIKKFFNSLEIKNLYFNTKLVLLFIYIQYLKFLKNKKLEEKSHNKKWQDLLLKIDEIYDLYQ